MILPVRKFRVFEESMMPTVMPGSVVITESLSYRFRRPKVGEIVVAAHDGVRQLKRVIKAEQDRYLLAGDNRELSTVFETKRKYIIGRVLYAKGIS